jgi:CheY-like chemotaxis protein
LEPLNGKRIGLAGFSTEAAAALTDEFDKAMAFCRVLTARAASPGSEVLENFDLLVASWASAQPWFKVRGRDSDVPLLVVGTADEIAAELKAFHLPGRDFLLENHRAEELHLRAAMLVDARAGRESGPRRAPLVVAADDEMSITALVKALLSSDGITCETADNGGDALELARKLKPDVLVLDVNMPHLGGFEVLSAVKLDPATAGTRVILLTGAEQESDIMRGFSLGAADYVVKPFNPMELLVRIRRFIRTR